MSTCCGCGRRWSRIRQRRCSFTRCEASGTRSSRVAQWLVYCRALAPNGSVFAPSDSQHLHSSSNRYRFVTPDPLPWSRMIKKLLQISLLGALMACLLYGQTASGRIAGTVTDSTGAVVPDAAVTIVDEKNGNERTVVADNAGFYIAPNLSPSTYKVTAKGNNLGPTEYT